MEPESQQLNGIGFYEGYNYQANVLLFNPKADEELKNNIVRFLGDYEAIEYGATVTYCNLIVIRILGKSSEKLKVITDALEEYVIEILR